MACVYSIDGGVTYMSEEEFKDHLSKGGLDSLVSEGSVNPVRLKPNVKDVTIEAKYNQGKTAMDVAQEMGIGEEEIAAGEMRDFIADHSQNAFEIAEEYNKVIAEAKDAAKTKQGSDLFQWIKDNGIRVTSKDFARVVGKSFLSDYVIKNYIDENAEGVDVIASDKASAPQNEGGLGRTINQDEIIQAMVAEDMASMGVGYAVAEKLKDQYKKVTGVRLTNKEAKRVTDKGVKDAIADYEKESQSMDAETQLAEKTEKQRSLADSVRGLKVKLGGGGLQSNILGLPIEMYNAVVETVALAIDGGMTLAKAIDKAITEHKLNQVKEFERDAFIAQIEGNVGQFVTGAHKKELARARAKYGLADAEKSASIELKKLEADAEKFVSETPEKIAEILDRATEKTEDGNFKNAITPLEIAILREYSASLQDKLNNNPTPELLTELQRVVDVLSAVGRLFGQQLGSLRGMVVVKDSLADFLVQASKALGVSTMNEEEIAKYKALHENFVKPDEVIEETKKDIVNDFYGSPAEAAFKQMLKDNEDLKKKIEAYQKGKDKTKTERAVRSAFDKVKERLREKSKKKPFTFKDKDGNDIITDDPTVNGLTSEAFLDLIANASIGAAKIADKVLNAIEAVRDSEWYQKLDNGDRERFKKVVEEALSEGKEFDYNETVEKIKESVNSVGFNEHNARDIKDLVRQLIKDGERDFNAIAEKVSNDLGIAGKEKIFSIVGGEYTSKKTKSELQTAMHDMISYAKLVDKYNKLLNGETFAKAINTPNKQRRAEIDLIKKAIEDLEKKLGLKPTPLTAEEKVVQAREKRLKELNDKLLYGNLGFPTPKNKITSPEIDALEKEIEQAEKDLKDARQKAGILPTPLTAEEKAVKAIRKRIYEAWAKLGEANAGIIPLPNAKNTGASSPLIDRLKTELDDVKKELKDALDKSGIKDRDTLDRKAKNALKAAAEFKRRIRDKDFASKERNNILTNPEIEKQQPARVAKLRKAMREKNNARIDFIAAMHKDAMANRGKREKVFDAVKKTVNTVGKLKATLDASFMGVHAYYVLFTNPKLWGKGLASSIAKALSNESFDDYINALKEDADTWDEYNAVGLSILDYHAIKEGEAEGILRRTWLDEHTVFGKKINVGKYTGVEIADRAFISMGNIIRTQLYDMYTQPLKDNGKTYLTHPEEFRQMAKLVNNITGRADVAKKAQNDLVNTIVWSPAKLAARMNVIGLGDLYSVFDKESKGYYRDATWAVNKIRVKNAAKVIGGGLLIMAAASKFLGAEVDDDDESPTYGWVTFPNGVQWNVFGEELSLLKAVMRIMRGDKEKSGEALLHYTRGKMAPIPAVVTDLMVGKTYMKENVYDINGKIKPDWMLEQVSPMAVRNIYDELKRDPFIGSVMLAPQFLGVPVYNERSWAKIVLDQEEEDYKIKNKIDMTPERYEELMEKEAKKAEQDYKKEIKKSELLNKYR